jgi:hypothetical protein
MDGQILKCDVSFHQSICKKEQALTLNMHVFLKTKDYYQEQNILDIIIAR